MSAALKDYWSRRTRREQRLLLAMAALLAVVLGWLLVIRPLAAAQKEAEIRHEAAVTALAEAKAAAAARGATSEAPPPPPLPIDGLVSRTATANGFTNAEIAGQGPERASVAIPAARPQAAFAWIAGLERQGVAVESLRARANRDQTLSIEVQFAAGGR